ncbi:uncharacterized protein APUU_61356A [Aspergillus puulaauensis]|uniref:Homeodomain-like protein n=1 Tax=Aspergillus puulaauensis TaxID=1220207 RepID=A0A7R7XWK8_9EURO|nr:uncharacterized protein APUU_61356A [Aspergillus puulaauensis]BCS28308.1 hypothetical protein APUU_61356A [Aspergillus puulaauensis]
MMNATPDETPFLMIRRRRNWTPEEDMILKREVRRVQGEGDNISWHEIAAYLPGRTNKDCRKRWYGTAAVKVKKGPWTEAEDERLRRAIERHGTKWSVVASMVATRLPDQCSKRWGQAINPDIDHSPWTQHEDDLLIEQVNKHGHYWQQIVSHHFPGRTSLAAKNRYHILQRRLKSQQTGITRRFHGLSNTPWQDILWSDNSPHENRDQDISSSATPQSDLITLPTGHGNSPFVFDDSSRWLPTSYPTFHPTSCELDVDSTAFPFPLVDQIDSTDATIESETPPTMSIDDLVSQAFGPGSSPTGAPSFPPGFLSDTSPPGEAKPDANHRRVCIQAVCSSDKVGAVFEAVTKLSVSAAIKMDN